MMVRKKRQPQRTCLGCRTVTDKKDLLRIVRTPEGAVEVDLGGKKSGRGAYLCRDAECLETSFASRRLESALRRAMSPADRERLKEDLARCLNESRA